jgi:hypothetical protein
MLSETACPDNSGKSSLSAAKAGFAGKKIIIYLTIFSFLNLVGCSFHKQMNPGEFDFEDNWDMQVTTKDTTYAISSDDYYYANDTLFVKVPIQLDKKTSAKLKVSIPVETIETIEAQKMDVLGTVAIFGAIAFVIYALSTLGDLSW